MTSTSLPAVAPDIAADLLSALPSRLKRRAEALAAESSSWSVQDGVVAIGEHTVTVAEDITCSCLLSPKCAHVGAVVLAAPVGAATEVPVAEVPVGGVQDVAQDVAQPEKLVNESALNTRIQLASRCTDLVNACLKHGLGALSIQDYAGALALLQSTRAAVLPRLERALTGVVGGLRSTRLGTPPGRDDLGNRLSTLALAAFVLARDPTSEEAIGQTRRSYSNLDGKGTGIFVPLMAEPVVAASGFAGVVVTFADTQGELFQLAHTPPGEAKDVASAWEGRAALGDLHCSYSQLAKHKLLLSGGRTSADGRIGRGKGVRAALGEAVGITDLPEVPGFEYFSGTVISGDRRGFILRTDSGDIPLSFLSAARRAGLGDVLSWLKNQPELQVVSRDRHVVRGFTSTEQVFPGLDHPDGTDLPDDSGPRELRMQTLGVSELLSLWCGIVTAGGAVALGGQSNRLANDAAKLDALAAPVAAGLLRSLLTELDATALARIQGYLGNF
ncbi:MAG TPA: SWIM zinc finger family protein [Corynebacterium glutamicum]|nr:SWIM zinc finger family protein [Corynebacterium glutamicum]